MSARTNVPPTNRRVLSQDDKAISVPVAVTNSPMSEQLLTQIRDYLEIVATASFAAFANATLDRLGDRGLAMRKAVTSDQQWAVVLLLDGTRSQAEVCAQSGFDSGGLSRLVAKLRELGMCSDSGGRPSMAFTRMELLAMRGRM